jgi:flavodoxin
MKNAIIFYNSKHGTTKRYAEEIGVYLAQKGIGSKTLSISDYSDSALAGVDYLFLGCWTSGLFFFLQHPEKNWKDFAVKLPKPLKAKVALFTTYKMLTGSLFNGMRKELKIGIESSSTELKSRNGLLSQTDKLLIDKFVG